MSRSLPYAGVDTFQVVMGVITRMLARPELPPDCAFAQQLQEIQRRYSGDIAEIWARYRPIHLHYISPTSPLHLPHISPTSRLHLAQELMRSCWCEEPADRPRFNQALYISPTSPLDLP